MKRRSKSNYTTEMRLLRKQMKPTVPSKRNKLTTRDRWRNIAYNAKISEHMDALKNKHATLMTIKQDIKSIEKLFNCKSLHDVPNIMKRDYIKKSEISDYISDNSKHNTGSNDNKLSQNKINNSSNPYNSQSYNQSSTMIPNFNRNNSDTDNQGDNQK